MTGDDSQRPPSESIERSLELERQLELEGDSPPLSPRQAARPGLLDPQVLASLVSSLTAERDALASALETSREQEEQLRTELNRHLERAASQDEELKALRTKNEESEESIALLRSTVEDSRRALMRLQTEGRRGHNSGNMSLDLSRTSGFSFGGSPPSAKRASFTPLAGSSSIRGHQRRVSNASNADTNLLDPLPSSRSRLATSSEVLPDGSTVLSLPPKQGDYHDVVHSPRSPNTRVDAEALQREIQSLKTVLEGTRVELAEANEARDASDTCVKALRDFIAMNSVGSAPLAGMPQITRRATTETKIAPAGAGSSRWAFGLWRPSEPAKEPTEASLATLNMPSSAAAEPLSKKLGNIFAGRQPSLNSAASAEPHVIGENGSGSSSTESPESIVPLDVRQKSRFASAGAPVPLATASHGVKTAAELSGPITVAMH